MEHKNLIFEYGFDFSSNNCDFRKIDRARKNNFPKKYKKKYSNAINPEGKKRLFKVRESLFYIAKKNKANVKVKIEKAISKVSVETESDFLYFDSDKLKKCLIDAVEYSKFLTIESRINGRFAIVSEA